MSMYDEDSICRVTNVGDRPFTLGLNSREWRIVPGKSLIVNVHAAINAFGDPRSSTDAQGTRIKNSDQVVILIPDRVAEVRRLRLRYGILDGPENTFMTKEMVVPDHIPQARVELMDDGEFIPVATVLEDPEGLHADSAHSSLDNDLDALLAAHRKQQALIDKLIAARGIPGDDFTSEDIPVDDPNEAALGPKAKASAK